jgi:putative ATPase
MDLFTHAMNERMKNEAPLAARMHPRNLDEAAKEQRSSARSTSSARANCCAAPSKPTGCLVPLSCGAAGDGQNDPGAGHRHTTKLQFETLSAVMAGKAELREVIEKALERRKLYQQETVLFVKDVVEALN